MCIRDRYLIEQTYRQDFYGISGRKSLKLNFNHPVKYIVWCGQRNDVDETIGGSLGSGFNNYTNFKSEYIHPSSPAYVTDLGKTKIIYYIIILLLIPLPEMKLLVYNLHV